MKQLVKSLSYILTISLLVLLIPTNPVSASTPTYIYEWMSQSGTSSSDLLAHEYTNLEAGQTIDLSLTLINRSNTIIKDINSLPQSPNLQVPIGSYGIGSQTPYQDGTPYFLDTSSFVLNNNRFRYHEGSDILPDEAISMSWTIKLANNLSDGVYNLYVRPVSEYLAWTRQIKTGKLLPTTSSDIFWRLVVGDGESGDWQTYAPQGTDFVFDYPSSWEIKREVSFPFPDTSGVIALVALGEKGKIYPGGEPITVNLYRNSGRSIDNAIDWWTDYLGSDDWEITKKSNLNQTSGYKNDYKSVIYRLKNREDITLHDYFVINEHGFVIQVDVSDYNDINYYASERITHTIR